MTNPIKANSIKNKIEFQDRPIHNWYRFVLSFPPHLVREYISKFNLNSTSCILDPFCGTGTTLVEAKLNQINCIGIDVNPMSCLASNVKTQWDIDISAFRNTSWQIV